jgi:hypothetical protein
MLKAVGEWKMTLVDGLRFQNITRGPAHSRKAATSSRRLAGVM